jgi:hypothetical protein
VFVGTLAYQYSRKAPQTTKPHPNVAIQLCSIEACLLHSLDDPHCPHNVEFCRDLEEWTKICDHVYVWNYNVNFANYMSPCPNLTQIGPNIKFLASNRVRGVFMQAAGNGSNTELAELRNYLISRLLWDPSADAQAIQDEFVSLYYGRSAENVHNYLTLMHEAAAKSGLHRNCFALPSQYGITESVAKQALKELSAGMKVAENEEMRRRIEKLMIAPRAVLIEPLAAWVWQNREAAFAGTAQPPANLLDKLEPELREFVNLCERHEVDRVAEYVPLEQFRQLLPRDWFEQ